MFRILRLVADYFDRIMKSIGSQTRSGDITRKRSEFISESAKPRVGNAALVSLRKLSDHIDWRWSDNEVALVGVALHNNSLLLSKSL